MKEVNLEKLKAQIPERAFDELHAADPWFRMQFKAGYARALWNFTVALMDAEADNLATAYQIASDSKDLTHLCGLHKFKFRASRWEEMRWFFTKLWHNPKILELKPQLREYIEFICENSRVRWGKANRPLGLLPEGPGRGSQLDRLPWRTPEWWHRRYRAAHPLTPIPCARCSTVFLPTHGLRSYCDKCRAMPHAHISPLVEFYPYIASRPTDEHELLLAVDSAVPRWLSHEVRGDVCQDLIVTILSGELDVRNLHDETPKFIKQFMKQMPSKYSHISLDAPLMGDSTVSLIDVISAEEYEDACSMARVTAKSPYGDSLSDCENASDLAERLQDAWEANRLKTPRRKTYSRFSANHEDDNRRRVASPQISGRVGMGSKFRHNLKPIPHRAGIEKKLDELSWATEDYLEQRREEEISAAHNLS